MDYTNLPYDVIVQPSGWVSYGSVLSAGAVVFSAGAGVLVAIMNIRAQRRIARRRATLDFISTREWDSDYLKARAEFNRLKRSDDIGLAFWMSESHRDSPQVEVIRTILNDYELVAIGVLQGDLDDDLYRNWFKSSLVADYDFSKAAIDELRTRFGLPKLYQNFAELAERWRVM